MLGLLWLGVGVRRIVFEIRRGLFWSQMLALLLYHNSDLIFFLLKMESNINTTLLIKQRVQKRYLAVKVQSNRSSSSSKRKMDDPDGGSSHAKMETAMPWFAVEPAKLREF